MKHGGLSILYIYLLILKNGWWSNKAYYIFAIYFYINYWVQVSVEFPAPLYNMRCTYIFRVGINCFTLQLDVISITMKKVTVHPYHQCMLCAQFVQIGKEDKNLKSIYYNVAANCNQFKRHYFFCVQ